MGFTIISREDIAPSWATLADVWVHWNSVLAAYLNEYSLSVLILGKDFIASLNLKDKNHSPVPSRFASCMHQAKGNHSQTL